jgi:hypothetical protein
MDHAALAITRHGCCCGNEQASAARIDDIARYGDLPGLADWGKTAPQPIRSFLGTHDPSCKTLRAFITHAGYGVGRSLACWRAAREMRPSRKRSCRRSIRSGGRWIKSGLARPDLRITAKAPSNAESAIHRHIESKPTDRHSPVPTLYIDAGPNGTSIWQSSRPRCPTRRGGPYPASDWGGSRACQLTRIFADDPEVLGGRFPNRPWSAGWGTQV